MATKKLSQFICSCQNYRRRNPKNQEMKFAKNVSLASISPRRITSHMTKSEMWKIATIVEYLSYLQLLESRFLLVFSTLLQQCCQTALKLKTA